MVWSARIIDRWTLVYFICESDEPLCPRFDHVNPHKLLHGHRYESDTYTKWSVATHGHYCLVKVKAKEKGSKNGEERSIYVRNAKSHPHVLFPSGSCLVVIWERGPARRRRASRSRSRAFPVVDCQAVKPLPLIGVVRSHTCTPLPVSVTALFSF